MAMPIAALAQSAPADGYRLSLDASFRAHHRNCEEFAAAIRADKRNLHSVGGHQFESADGRMITLRGGVAPDLINGIQIDGNYIALRYADGWFFTCGIGFRSAENARRPFDPQMLMEIATSYVGDIVGADADNFGGAMAHTRSADVSFENHQWASPGFPPERLMAVKLTSSSAYVTITSRVAN